MVSSLCRARHKIGGFGIPFNVSRFPAGTSFLDAVLSCHDFECLHDAHLLPRPAGVFPFPAFIIIGWQKCATTSLYRYGQALVSPLTCTLMCCAMAHACQRLGKSHYVWSLQAYKAPNAFNKIPELMHPKPINSFSCRCHCSHFKQHPQIVIPATKEAEFFTFSCNYDFPEGCSNFGSSKYIQRTLNINDFILAKGTKAAFEASTHIVRSGDMLSMSIRRYMPWLKLVVSLREPISRAASMLIHLKDLSQEGCLAKRDASLGHCLLTDSQLNMALAEGQAANYSFPMHAWLEEWPREQVYVFKLSYRGTARCVCVCVCEREREREREKVGIVLVFPYG